MKYPTVMLVTRDRLRASIPIHKIIAYALWGDKAFSPGIHVRHLDGNAANFAKENLALGTAHDNAMDKSAEVRKQMAHKAMMARDPNRKRIRKRRMTDDQIREAQALVQYNPDGRIRWGSVSALASKYGVSDTTLTRCIRLVLDDPSPPAKVRK